MLKIQKIQFQESVEPHWIVIGEDFLPIEPISKFLLFLRNTGKSIYTVRTYAYHLKIFWEYITNYKYNWKEISLDNLACFIGHLNGLIEGNVIHLNITRTKRSARTINQVIMAVTGFYQYHHDLGNVAEIIFYHWKSSYYSGKSFKPFLSHISKSQPKRHSVLKIKETKLLPKVVDDVVIRKMIDACKHKRDKLLICLLYESGCRIGQALGLRHEDIESFNNLIVICPRFNNSNNARAKTFEENRINVTKELMQLYYEYYITEYGDLDSDYVFVNLWKGELGQPLSYKAVITLFQRLSKKIGVHITPHMLRHTHATQLLESGWTMAHVQKRLGHKNIETTMNNYIHLSEKNLKEEYCKFINKRNKPHGKFGKDSNKQ